MTFSQLPMVTVRALKLDYASLIFVDPEVQIDETYLNYLTTVAAYHTQDLCHLVA